ncbi:hypothetical protein MSSAC_0241 [Methanosarcina siciliae C2J]|uniref:Uncharacterized protein n=1 Tax=Methanosarcina siciliae C2J TaxID=1434118 RepID=A0A0E3LC35_9EURY|nr:hypothetical protein [Methanosarcina siciliae]AKB34831.1 hypothetical protein MSSAC_0241 [Methanosarcina siciliae C2J]
MSRRSVLIFSGLTTYDSKKLKRLNYRGPEILDKHGLFNEKNKKESENKTDAKPEGKEKSEKKSEKIKSP